MDLLSIAGSNKGKDYGYVTIAGRAPTIEQIAKLIISTPEEVVKLIDELEKNEVFSRDKRKIIYSRRMVRSQKNRTNGREGGNPNLLKTNETPNSVNHSLVLPVPIPEPEPLPSSLAPKDSFSAMSPSGKKDPTSAAAELAPALTLTEEQWRRLEAAYPAWARKEKHREQAVRYTCSKSFHGIAEEDRERSLKGFVKNRNTESGPGGVFAPDSREVTRPQNIVTPEQEKYNEEQRIRARAFREKNAHRGYIS
jgi:hypothetical protein